MTGADVVSAAREHLGTRWVHQGRMPGVALDCAGLVIIVARKLGSVAPDFDVNGYSRTPDGTMLEFCDRHMQRIESLELGAVLTLATEKEPQHLGIVGDYRHGGWSVIHAASNAGKVIETRLMFAKNFVLRGIYRLPGVVSV
jgi:cell wall-associated NlpC family hydrolase